MNNNTKLHSCKQVIELENLTVSCPNCDYGNPQRPDCLNCDCKFTEHICICCGVVWYCSTRRYEPHELWNHKYCPNCHLRKPREEQLVPNHKGIRVIRGD